MTHDPTPSQVSEPLPVSAPRHTRQLSVEEIKNLGAIHVPAALHAYQESMAGFRNTQDVFAGLEQKALVLFSVLVTVLSGLVAFAIDADTAVVLWACAAAALPVAGAMVAALMALAPRWFVPPFTGPEHWVHYRGVETELGYAQTLLWLANLVGDERWEPRNRKVNAQKAECIHAALWLLALSPIAAGIAAGAAALIAGPR